MLIALLIIVFLLLLFIFKQSITFKKSFGVYKNIELVVEETKRKKLQELENELEFYKTKQFDALDAEIEKQRLTIQEIFETERSRIKETNLARKEALELEYDARRRKLEEDYISLKMQQEHNKQDLLDRYKADAQQIESDKEIIINALDDLKSKQSNTIKVLKEAAKNENELNFHKVILSKEELSDIAELEKVEKLIHNKDVLRKLIYKTYIEKPMNDMFNRLSITTTPGIYKIENTKDGKVYIGQSTNVRNRLREHLKAAIGISTIASQSVHDAMTTEGIEHFTFHLIDDAERDKLNDREKYWIDFYESNEWGYNRTKGGS